MKRTNVVLDEQILEQATRTLGFKTYSATIDFALKEAVRTHNVRSLRQFFGGNLWEGDLTEMREDHPETERGRPLPEG
jgi:Arc/MetJ family transcription regulator